MKGYRTLLVNAAVALVGVAQSFDWTTVVAPNRVGLVLTGIGVVNMVLRALTDTPVGQK